MGVDSGGQHGEPPDASAASPANSESTAPTPQQDVPTVRVICYPEGNLQLDESNGYSKYVASQIRYGSSELPDKGLDSWHTKTCRPGTVIEFISPDRNLIGQTHPLRKIQGRLSGDERIVIRNPEGPDDKKIIPPGNHQQPSIARPGVLQHSLDPPSFSPGSPTVADRADTKGGQTEHERAAAESIDWSETFGQSTNQFHQVIYTHCTKATSARNRFTGENKDETKGYDVRATSVDDPNEAYTLVRQLSSYVNYELPGGITTEGRADLSPDEAPVRLAFCQSKNTNMAVIGQVCYQPEDVTGHATGSLFAHVLLIQPDKQFATLDLLRLWKAPFWRQENADLKDLPHSIDALSSAKLQNAFDSPPILNDDTLAAFLTEPDIQSNDALKQFVPDSWLASDVARRQRLLQYVLNEFLLARTADQRLVLLAEPAYATLLFYGTLRFLPSDSFARNVEFSTYEHEENLKTASPMLSATYATSIDDYAALKDRVRSMGHRVINTESRKHQAPGNDRGHNSIYVQEAFDSLNQSSRFDRFSANGWDAVDRFLRRFADQSDSGPETLAYLSGLCGLARQFVNPEVFRPGIPDDGLMESATQDFNVKFPKKKLGPENQKLLKSYLQRAVYDYVFALEDNQKQRRVADMLKQERYFPVLRFLQGTGFFWDLLNLLPDEQDEKFFVEPSFSLDFRLELLLRDQRSLPDPKRTRLKNRRAPLIRKLLSDLSSPFRLDVLDAANLGNQLAQEVVRDFVNGLNKTDFTTAIHASGNYLLKAHPRRDEVVKKIWSLYTTSKSQFQEAEKSFQKRRAALQTTVDFMKEPQFTKAVQAKLPSVPPPLKAGKSRGWIRNFWFWFSLLLLILLVLLEIYHKQPFVYGMSETLLRQLYQR